MARIDPQTGHEFSLLDVDWPAPLVAMPEIEQHTPWLLDEVLLLAYAPPRLIDVAALVTSQENACRFCYGSIRASMRVFGYSDEQIRDLEQEVQLADGLTKEVVIVARKLARSNPRPVRAELAGLEHRGLDPKAIAELVFSVASTCYANRVASFLALPPQRGFERFAETWAGRLVGPLFLSITGRRTRRVGPTEPVRAQGFLAPLVRQLPDTPLAAWFARLLERCFVSSAVELRTKLLMLAVIARVLDSRFCEQAARADLERSGFPADSCQRALETLAGPELSERDRLLLDWARETVHYETATIQKRTRRLAENVEAAVLLEAVGTAAVSNTAVRLAMLLE